jgi:hypothetical protein
MYSVSAGLYPTRKGMSEKLAYYFEGKLRIRERLFPILHIFSFFGEFIDLQYENPLLIIYRVLIEI